MPKHTGPKRTHSLKCQYFPNSTHTTQKCARAHTHKTHTHTWLYCFVCLKSASLWGLLCTLIFSPNELMHFCQWTNSNNANNLPAVYIQHAGTGTDIYAFQFHLRLQTCRKHPVPKRLLVCQNLSALPQQCSLSITLGSISEGFSVWNGNRMKKKRTVTGKTSQGHVRWMHIIIIIGWCSLWRAPNLGLHKYIMYKIK